MIKGKAYFVPICNFMILQTNLGKLGSNQRE